jgi:hypothetical protein
VAKRLGWRIHVVKQTPAALVNMLNRHYGTRVNAQIRKALSRYPKWDGKGRITKCVPVPRPDYELNYGGPYSHIIHANYCQSWGCVFGLRTDGKIVLWMD